MHKALNSLKKKKKVFFSLSLTLPGRELISKDQVRRHAAQQ
jgi:hypothetical protein